jgi:transcriptional regulator with XRE-family HTH domain
MSSDSLCKLLRNLRIKNNYTQAYLGKILGKNQSYYSRLETGNATISLDEVKTLAKEYKVSLNSFFEDDIIQDKTNEIEPSTGTDSFKEHLIKCVKDEEYFRLFRAYIKLCRDNGIEPDF